MISVVIPLYNKEGFIADTIRSVLHQTFDRFEIIVVDDGSLDASAEVVSQFDDPRIRVVSIAHSGVSVARNTGMEQATYNWIAFLDADDWWAPTFLEEMVKSIDAYPLQKIFATGRTRVFSDTSERYKHRYLPMDGKTGIVNYFKITSKYLPPINASNVVVEKSLFYEIGKFRKDQSHYEDHDLWLRLCVKQAVVFVNKSLSFYRKTEEVSASGGVYTASDFCTYLSTMVEVNDSLSEENIRYFRKYTNRFVFLTFLKYNWEYTFSERSKVYALARQLLTFRRRLALSFFNALPFNLYSILKRGKR